jgi:hypothetical protein
LIEPHKILRAASLLVLGILVCLVSVVVYDLHDVNRVIGANVAISHEWREITPPFPLKTWKQNQYITLDVEGAKRSVNSDGLSSGYEIKHFSEIELVDGTLVTPEIQLVDEYGESFSLRGSMENYAGRGFTTSLPSDRVYRTVRIRSDKPMNCKKIIWHCRTPK